MSLKVWVSASAENHWELFYVLGLIWQSSNQSEVILLIRLLILEMRSNPYDV